MQRRPRPCQQGQSRDRCRRGTRSKGAPAQPLVGPTGAAASTSGPALAKGDGYSQAREHSPQHPAHRPLYGPQQPRLALVAAG